MRNDLITKINNLFDEVTDLRARNSFLESQRRKEMKCVDTTSETTEIKIEQDRKLIDYAKKNLISEVLRGYTNMKIKKVNDKYEFTSFDEWTNYKIYNDYIPSQFSKEDIKNILFTELTEMYESEKAKAIKEYEKQEQKEEE